MNQPEQAEKPSRIAAFREWVCEYPDHAGLLGIVGGGLTLLAGVCGAAAVGALGSSSDHERPVHALPGLPESLLSSLSGKVRTVALKKVMEGGGQLEQGQQIQFEAHLAYITSKEEAVERTLEPPSGSKGPEIRPEGFKVTRHIYELRSSTTTALGSGWLVGLDTRVPDGNAIIKAIYRGRDSEGRVILEKFTLNKSMSGEMDLKAPAPIEANSEYAPRMIELDELGRAGGRDSVSSANNDLSIDEIIKAIQTTHALSGLRYYLENRFNEAIPHYEKALALAPNSRKAHHDLALTIIQNERESRNHLQLERAMNLLKEALKLAPEGLLDDDRIRESLDKVQEIQSHK